MFIYQDMARAIRTAYDLPPDPVTGLREADVLWRFYLYLDQLAVIHFDMPKMRRKIGIMADWAGRLFAKAARANRAAALKREMLSDPRWKARVLKDLGGDKALQRWDTLWAAHQARIKDEPVDTKAVDTTPVALPDPEAPETPSEPASNPSDSPHQKPRKAPRMDRKGQFRLKPVPRHIDRIITPPPYVPPAEFYERIDGPIELIPDELRYPLPRPGEGDLADSVERRRIMQAIEPENYAYTLSPDEHTHDNLRAHVWAQARAAPIWQCLE